MVKKLKIGEIEHLNGDKWMIRLDKEKYYTAKQDTIMILQQLVKISRNR
jgi:hypothetical protein